MSAIFPCSDMDVLALSPKSLAKWKVDARLRKKRWNAKRKRTTTPAPLLNPALPLTWPGAWGLPHDLQTAPSSARASSTGLLPSVALEALCSINGFQASMRSWFKADGPRVVARIGFMWVRERLSFPWSRPLYRCRSFGWAAFLDGLSWLSRCYCYTIYPTTISTTTLLPLLLLFTTISTTTLLPLLLLLLLLYLPPFLSLSL